MEAKQPTARVVGAGIAGIATAHALAVTHGVRRVLLVDERAPLTLTSDNDLIVSFNYKKSRVAPAVS